MKTTKTPTLLNLDAAPEDPIERLLWLSGVADQVQVEMADQYADAYYWARFSGRLDAAVAVGLHSRRRIMAFTRKANEANGRTVRWNDGQ